ncbi:MAG TPA: valine--tRNA ligase [Gemmatimonadales bacterium]|nr:valine--tRNA ligase [Gemmatimonadales bacterium]
MTETRASLPPQYDPSQIEAALYRWWQERHLYEAHRDTGREPYVVMMPPPNVTANLHMGHGLNNTVQDVLARFERMRGKEVLWLPGTDHAGIATQNVVERLLAKEGKTRFDLGRDEFVARVWEYVRATGATILEQLRALGASCDWSRTYFTLDEDLSRAVREVFVQLFEKGLIYRGHYIINWCPRCLTALSNEEAEKEEIPGALYHLRYPLAAGGHLVVATTRPETMLGDTAVAVHPDDPRYRDLIGTEVLLPLADRRIPIVADDAVDPAFGTGAVKVTPAHDPTDFEIGKRHDLPAIDVMTPDARMSDAVPERFRGLDRFDARKKVVHEFDILGLLEKVEPHQHAVGHCYRCGTIVEPRLSDQWFVKMRPLAQPALGAYRAGHVRFIPERRGDDYEQWLENIRDWVISRQLWWGHRIPVWYCENPACAQTTVSRTDLTACPGCGGPVRQDEDVLDTWFSSWLVPFSSLGWPERTPDLAAFYPGDTLVTAPEIIFFWVARMIMAGVEFMGEPPFHTVYLHGTVRDTQHRKMSKSLGNGIDPLEVVARYGADALRFQTVSGMAVGTDLILDPNDLESSFAAGRNFANKLWNMGRFLLSNLDGPTRPLAGRYTHAVRPEELTLADRWIIARCEATVVEATEAYERFRLNEAAAAVYRFLWNDLADWYFEQIKPRLYGDLPGGDVARAVAAQVFDVGLRLLHPVMPFVTEALWKRFPGRPEQASISRAPWPTSDPRAQAPDALAQFGLVQETVGAIRAIRAEYGIQPGTAVRASITTATPAARQAVEREMGTILRLAKVSAFAVTDAAAPGAGEGGDAGGHAVLSDGSAIVVPLGDTIDLAKECARLGAEADRLRGLVAGQEKKLANEQFVARAPADVVAREREKLESWREQVAVLDDKRRRLGC